jgi:hypothetical protein
MSPSSGSYLTYIDLRVCGVAIYDLDNDPLGPPWPPMDPPVFADYQIEARRIRSSGSWPQWPGGRLDHEYFTDGRAIVLNPFWPVGPHDGLVGRWVRPGDAGATLASEHEEALIEADGGGTFISSSGSVSWSDVTEDAQGIFRVGIFSFRSMRGPDGGIEVIHRHPFAAGPFGWGWEHYARE